MAACLACATIRSDAITPFGKWPRRPNSSRWPPTPRGFRKYEIRGGNPRADSPVQALSEVRLAADSAAESHAISVSEVQFPLPDLQHLDEARERADHRRMGQSSCLFGARALLVHDQRRSTIDVSARSL